MSPLVPIGNVVGNPFLQKLRTFLVFEDPVEPVHVELDHVRMDHSVGTELQSSQLLLVLPGLLFHELLPGLGISHPLINVMAIVAMLVAGYPIVQITQHYLTLTCSRQARSPTWRQPMLMGIR